MWPAPKCQSTREKNCQNYKKHYYNRKYKPPSFSNWQIQQAKIQNTIELKSTINQLDLTPPEHLTNNKVHSPQAHTGTLTKAEKYILVTKEQNLIHSMFTDLSGIKLESFIEDNYKILNYLA